MDKEAVLAGLAVLGLLVLSLAINFVVVPWALIVALGLFDITLTFLQAVAIVVVLKIVQLFFTGGK